MATGQDAFDFLVKLNPFEIKESVWWMKLQMYRSARGMKGIRDLAGVVVFYLDRDLPFRRVMTCLAHDINGANDEFMLPRSDGFEEYINEMHRFKLMEYLSKEKNVEA